MSSLQLMNAVSDFKNEFVQHDDRVRLLLLAINLLLQVLALSILNDFSDNTSHDLFALVVDELVDFFAEVDPA